MSKRLVIMLESSNKKYPAIMLEIAIPEDLAKVIEATPITSTTIKITDSIFFTAKAQKEELKGELNRFRIPL